MSGNQSRIWAAQADNAEQPQRSSVDTDHAEQPLAASCALFAGYAILGSQVRAGVMSIVSAQMLYCALHVLYSGNTNGR